MSHRRKQKDEKKKQIPKYARIIKIARSKATCGCLACQFIDCERCGSTLGQSWELGEYWCPECDYYMYDNLTKCTCIDSAYNAIGCSHPSGLVSYHEPHSVRKDGKRKLLTNEN